MSLTTCLRWKSNETVNKKEKKLKRLLAGLKPSGFLWLDDYHLVSSVKQVIFLCEKVSNTATEPRRPWMTVFFKDCMIIDFHVISLNSDTFLWSEMHWAAWPWGKNNCGKVEHRVYEVTANEPCSTIFHLRELYHNKRTNERTRLGRFPRWRADHERLSAMGDALYQLVALPLSTFRRLAFWYRRYGWNERLSKITRGRFDAMVTENFNFARIGECLRWKSNENVSKTRICK